MVTVLIRAFIIYFFLLLSLRFTGKRQLGELQVSELITTFMISELASAPIQDLSIPIIYSLIPIGFLLCAEVILSFLAIKSKSIKKIFFGNPSFIIRKGTIDQKELGRLRIGINELLGQLRLKSIGDVSQVEYAVLEQNGQLSVLKSNDNFAHTLIADGEINSAGLDLCGKNEEWLYNQLNARSLNKKEVFLMTVDENGQTNIIYKEEK